MQVCKELSCGRPVVSWGWCSKHYQRWRANQDPSVTRRAHNVKDPTCKPTDLDIAWAAGFLEGEGSFWGTQVRANQVQKQPLERLQALFGGSLNQRNNGTAKPIWQWAVCGEKARSVISAIYPWLSPRRKAQISGTEDNVLAPSA